MQKQFKTYGIIFAVVLFLFPFQDSTASSFLDVTEFTFARDVDKKKKEAVAPLTDRFDGKPLVFWTKIRGNKEAFQQLISTRKLPIVHVWERWVGEHSDLLNAEHIAESDLDKFLQSGNQLFSEEIKTDITNAAVYRKFGLEIDNLGNFDFRTWTRKENLRPGVYIVRIRYSDNTDLLCDDKPCLSLICWNC